MPKTTKGQAMTVEQMFLFTIGLLITVSVFFSFRAISDHVSRLAEEDQLNEVGTTVLTGIQRVAKELTYVDRAAITVEVPKEISRSEYTILSDGRSLIVLLPAKRVNATLPLEGAESAYLVFGRVTSSGGAVRIIGTQADRTIQMVRRV